MRNPTATTAATYLRSRGLRASILCLGLLLVGLTTPKPASADWVELSASGTRFYGRIKEQSEAGLVISSQGELFRFPMDQVSMFHRDQPAAKEAPQRRTRIWGAIEARVPNTFVELERDRPAFGSAGHLVALYEEAGTGARISLVRGQRPFGAKDFGTASRLLAAHFERNRGLQKQRWERTHWHQRPALFAELTTSDNVNRIRYLQGWIETAPGTVYCLSVVVPENAFLLSSERYRQLFASLRPHQPSH